DNQKNSIDYQQAENARFAQREKLPIADISLEGFCKNGYIAERHSAFSEDDKLEITNEGQIQYNIERPKFGELMHFLSKGYFKGVVCLCWDRISRNQGDEKPIRHFMKKGIDFRFTHAHYDKSSAGALHMDIDGMFAEHHSRVASEKVTIATRNKREQGICTYRAPVGYLNTGTMENKPFDPKRAPIIQGLFEKYAEGTWSLADLAKWANDQGLTTTPQRRRRTFEEMIAEDEVKIDPVERPIDANGVHKILTNPFYTGKILSSDGTHISSKSHKALVSQDLFDRVQLELHKKKVSMHYGDALPYPYRGLVRCAECERIYTPYEKKGIQYYGCRCRA
ncbi:MAG: recombinase family protein, partial [Patescibacteria group bacterium]